MKHNLGNFTRGSQLLGHFGFMFAAGLKWPLIIAVIAFGGLASWIVAHGLDDHHIYLVWMRIYAMGYMFMEFDPAKTVTMETVFGGTFQLPIARVETYPPVVRAWDTMLDLVGTAFAWTMFALVPAFALFYWIAERFGSHSKERRHERGASLVPLVELAREIRQHNRAERRRELTEILGWRRHLCLPSELQEVLPYHPSHIARLPYPWRLEQSHAMLIGTTGMGKTVALSEMVDEARERRQRAVIFDLTGAFIEHFYDPDRDVVLNPLDARCPRWNIFDECRSEGEFWAASEALVPHDGGGEAQFWVIAARALFVEFCLKLVEAGDASNEALARRLMSADLAKVHAMLRGTIADPITAPEAARMAESVRAVFNVNARALKLLPREGARFSIREWVEADGGEGGFVFLSARYVDLSVCTQLLTLWLDLAMNTLMTTARSDDLKMWFFIDELGALHRLPALETGLQTARNYGGAIVTGIHAYAKLQEVYGEHMAETLSSLAKTKLILGTGDYKTATWCSEAIGHAEVTDKDEAHTYAYNNARDAVSLTPRKHIEALVLPDQLKDMPSLTGYIKFPDGFPAAPVTLPPVKRVRCAEGFVPRAEDRASVRTRKTTGTSGKPVAPGVANTGEHPASNDDGVGKPSVPKESASKQGELQFGDRYEGNRKGEEGEREHRVGRQVDPFDAGDRAGVRVGKDAIDRTASGAPDSGLADGRQAGLEPNTAARPSRADGAREGEREVPDPSRPDGPARTDGPKDARGGEARPDGRMTRDARRIVLEEGLGDPGGKTCDAPPLDDLDFEL
ncbi:MAG: type IV secretion system DNA-binding domain-containing protein [Novosphingobium sp.]|nr:type IV secretion system DNA-binding domain-containing protein [Novosphingobium sp.]